MWKFLSRAIPSVLVLAAGIASVVYGVGYHVAAVTEEKEVEFSVPAPPDFAATGFPAPDFPAPGFAPPGFAPPGMPPFGDPSMPGVSGMPPVMTKVKQKVIVTKEVPELALIREVTFGGVALLDDGELRQTYSGAPPSLCPT